MIYLNTFSASVKFYPGRFVCPTTYSYHSRDIIKPLIGTNLLKFLYISKVFDKVWHDGILHKLKRNGKNGDLLKLIESFFIKQIPESRIK